MKPKFRDRTNWDRAELLMQPIYIRVTDNIRKYLEQSGQGWAESFVEVEVPRPGYYLRLRRTDAPETAAQIEFELWALCFEVCFQDFPPTLPVAATPDLEAEIEVAVDGDLLAEGDEVDWDAIDRKAAEVVARALGPVLAGP